MCFNLLQRPAIWAAPLMTVFAAGSGTKTGTCTGRLRPIRQVIEDPVGGRGGGTHLHSHALKKVVCFIVGKSKWEKAASLPHLQGPRRARQSERRSLFHPITGQDENDLMEVVCLSCRLVLCSTKRCKWGEDYATRQRYLWLALNGNATLFFFRGFRRGENVANYV